MKILHINYSDSKGGAARAVYRLHKALQEKGINSEMLVNEKFTYDKTVKTRTGRTTKINNIIRYKFDKYTSKFLLSENKNRHSTGFLPTYLSNYINKSDVDIAHLHWICGGMMSISDIVKINKPIVWTLHDMWAFSGAEHYSIEQRWEKGYFKNNRPKYEQGIDLDRIVWLIKKKHYKKIKNISLVTPSKWLSDCVKKSNLMSRINVSTIANTIDTNKWQPINKSAAKKLYCFKTNEVYIGFGSMSGAQGDIKGQHYLISALNHFSIDTCKINIVVFGSLSEKIKIKGVNLIRIGKLSDDEAIITLYNALDVVIVPSKCEAFGQIASEAHSCATPVVAFNTTGLKDIILHKKNGYLAEPFNSSDLAAGIKWIIANNQNNIIGKKARDLCVKRYHYSQIAEQYAELYNAINSGLP